MQMENIIIRY